jgi:hypothetical protein
MIMDSPSFPILGHVPTVQARVHFLQLHYSELMQRLVSQEVIPPLNQDL